jgi:hypothetical protein
MLWAGSNDGLEVALGGLAIQARLTPADTFNRDLHESELKPVQKCREFDPSIPWLEWFDPRNEGEENGRLKAEWALALTELETAGMRILTFKDGLDAVHQGLFSELENTDFVVGNIPDVTSIGLLLRIEKNNITVADAMKKYTPSNGPAQTSKFPFKADFFGRDITKTNDPEPNLLNARLRLQKMKVELNSEGKWVEVKDSGDWPEGTYLSYASLGTKLAYRVKQWLDGKATDEGGNRITPVCSWQTIGMAALFNPKSGLPLTDEAIYAEIMERMRLFIGKSGVNGGDDEANTATQNENWRRLRWWLFVNSNDIDTSGFAFRGDEVLTIDGPADRPDECEINRTKDTIDTFNDMLKKACCKVDGVTPRENVKLFDANALLRRADTNPGGLEVPDADNKLFGIYATCNGGLFSFDGVHPSKIGHMKLALEIAKAMREKAAARTETPEFGGIPWKDLNDAVTALENPELWQSLWNDDPVLKSARALGVEAGQ